MIYCATLVSLLRDSGRLPREDHLVTFKPPRRTRQLNAGDLAGEIPPYLFKGLDDDDSAWNLVRKRPICRLVESPDRDGLLPPEVTVIFSMARRRGCSTRVTR